GPDPFSGFGVEDIKKYFSEEEYEAKKEREEIITVNIGMIMEIRRVIVKDISIQIPPKFDIRGKPIEAIATVHFQTFEIVTKESLEDIYLPPTIKMSEP
ncbi:MAG: hypothetical protein ACTSU7_01920, partial [Candidatus Heimdallarchaeaceae archaeon]